MGMEEFGTQYINDLKKTLDKLSMQNLGEATEIILEAYREGRTIYVMGNGGSAATASHMMCDLNKGILGHKGDRDVRRFKVICLNDNIPTMMAWANDVGYDQIFEEQLKNFLQAGDVVIGISASGNSPNVVRACEYAKAHGGKVIGLVGFAGGRLKELSDAYVHADINSYEIAEDIHLILMHIIKMFIFEITKI